MEIPAVILEFSTSGLVTQYFDKFQWITGLTIRGCSRRAVAFVIPYVLILSGAFCILSFKATISEFPHPVWMYSIRTSPVFNAGPPKHGFGCWSFVDIWSTT